MRNQPEQVNVLAIVEGPLDKSKKGLGKRRDGFLGSEQRRTETIPTRLSLVSGRSGANRRIGGKMAKIEVEVVVVVVVVAATTTTAEAAVAAVAAVAAAAVCRWTCIVRVTHSANDKPAECSSPEKDRGVAVNTDCNGSGSFDGGSSGCDSSSSSNSSSSGGDAGGGGGGDARGGGQACGVTKNELAKILLHAAREREREK
ncbi:hypothetical protein M0804_003452 [Polistes exclamans]|nr:hypothetical protein M0804_003452 [Polistes exclamans]